jgi:hypothetical protein
MATSRKPAETPEPEQDRETQASPSQETAPATSAPAAVAERDAPTDEETALQRAFERISAAQREKDFDKSLELIKEGLDGLSEKQRLRLLEDPAIKRLIDTRLEGSSLAPGTKLRDRHGRLYGKKPWTKEDMIAAHGGEEAMVEWIPPQTRHVIINGVGIFVRAGVPVVSPPIYQQLANEAYQAELKQRQTAEAIMHNKFGDFGKVYDLD